MLQPYNIVQCLKKKGSLTTRVRTRWRTRRFMDICSRKTIHPSPLGL